MILVAGATGDLGGAVARMLLARGRRVRVLVRTGADHEVPRKAGTQIAVGDLEDRLSLDAACRGVDTVILPCGCSIPIFHVDRDPT